MFENVASVLGRIRWKSVLAVILLLGVAVVVLQYMPSSYQVSNGVGIKVSPNPSTISPGGSSVVDIELKNVNADKDLTVNLDTRTYDRNILFDAANSQTYRISSISIGPQETRKLNLKVKSNPETMQGTYTIDFKAIPLGEDKGAESRVSIKVEKGG
jgi:uncharacterized membrane protein